MPVTIRTVRLLKPFLDNGRSITIKHARSVYACTCGSPYHTIATGDLCAYVIDHRLGVRQHWHTDHLQEHWRLIVLDQEGQEVARFGC
jgi:Uri superfamily endonuclease